MRKINEIILHCTATTEGLPVSIQTIDKWHKNRGFAGIGYHYLIGIDGSVYVGRGLAYAGAHCKGHNANSIGVAYVGGIGHDGRPKDTRTHEQRVAMLELVERLARTYKAEVHGHNEYSNKACPCFDVKAEFGYLNDSYDGNGSKNR